MLSRAAIRSYSSAAVKVSAQDAPGALTSLSVVVKSGSKTGKPGLAHLLSKFNFLNTESKSALRFTRESELLGGIVSSNVTRDAIVLKTQFLKEDLPYYVEALGNVLAKASYRPHELVETVLPVAHAEATAARASNAFNALESLHEITFRKGLGNPLYYDGVTKFSIDDVRAFAQEVYVTENISVHAQGVVPADLEKFINESAFTELANGSSKSAPVQSFTGKEARIRAAGASTALIGVPVKPADFAKYEVLSAAVGNSLLPSNSTPLSSIPGASSSLYKYQDAGLFVVAVSGDAAAVAQGIKAAKKAVESISSAAVSKAVKSAQLSVALQSTLETPLDVKIDSSAAQGAKLGAFNYVAVGDVDVLPFADEL